MQRPQEVDYEIGRGNHGVDGEQPRERSDPMEWQDLAAGGEGALGH